MESFFMEQTEIDLLKNNPHTRGFSPEDLDKCPWPILNHLIESVREHSRRLSNNCGQAYHGML